MRVGTMMMRWKNENFPLGVALDKWPSKTCAMRILQGLRELSVVEELKWDLRKEESLCKPACDSVITIVTNWYSWWRSGRDTSGGWIMFTKTPEQGRTRGKERQIQHNNLQIAETPRHGAFLYIWCVAFSPLLAPCPSGHKLCDYRLWTPGPGQRKDVWDGQCCETSAQSVMQVWDRQIACKVVILGIAYTIKDDWDLKFIFNEYSAFLNKHFNQHQSGLSFMMFRL